MKVGAISIPRLPASQATEGLAFRRGFSFRALSAEDALGQSWTGRRECPGTTPNQSGLSTGSPHVASSLGRDRGRPWSLGRYRGLSRSRFCDGRAPHPPDDQQKATRGSGAQWRGKPRGLDTGSIADSHGSTSPKFTPPLPTPPTPSKRPSSSETAPWLPLASPPYPTAPSAGPQ